MCSMAAMRALHSLVNLLVKCLFSKLFAVAYDLVLNEIPEGRDALGMAQFFGVGEENRHFD